MNKVFSLKQGFSLPLIVAVVAAMIVMAGVAMATQKADAVVLTVTVSAANYDGDGDVAVNDIDDPSDTAAATAGVVGYAGPQALLCESLGAGTGCTGVLDASGGVAAPSGQLYRAAAVGSIVDVFATSTGDAILANDIYIVTTDKGNLNAAAGPQSLTLAAWDADADGDTVSEVGFALYADGSPGTASLSVTSGGITGIVTGAFTPEVQFVGDATTITAVADTGAGQAFGTLGAANSIAAGFTVNAFAAGYMQVQLTDINGEPALDGTQVQINTTHGALGGSFGTITGNASTVMQIVATNDSTGLAGALGADDHGLVAISVTTAATAPGTGVLTFSSIGTAPVTLSQSIDFFGAAATITATPGVLAAGAAQNVGSGPILGAGNLANSMQVTLVDAAGVPVSSGITTSGAVAAANIGLTAPAGSVGITAATTPNGTYPTTSQGLLGVYSIDLTTTAATVVGQYDLTIGITASTITQSITVSSATATAGTISPSATSVGAGESVLITANFTETNGYALTDGTAAPTWTTSLGTLTAGGATVSGNSIATLVAGASSGTATITAVSGAITVMTTVEIGSTSGGSPDTVTAGSAVSADANTPVAISVTVSRNSAAMSGGIVNWSSTGGSLSPTQVTTGADGVASTSFSAPAGTYTVTATVMTSGPVSLVPVAGLTSNFTVTVGGGTLTDSASSTFLSWASGEKTAATAFSGASNLTVVWRWNGSAWQSYSPGAPAAVNTNFSLSNGDVIYVVTTGAVTIG